MDHPLCPANRDMIDAVTRWLSTLALVASILLLGCSSADSGDGGVPGGTAGSGAGPGGAGPGGSGPGGAAPGGAGQGGTGEQCPAGVICVPSLPYTDANTTVGGDAALGGYSCAPDVNEAGPERVYRVDVPREGLLVASLAELGAGVDVDVHILQERDAGTCLARGNWNAAAFVPPGRLWIVVDSWVDGSGISQEGSYQLTLVLNEADGHVTQGLSPTVLGAGLSAFGRGWAKGDTEQLEYGIIDYTMPSIEHRFFVLDLRQGELLYAEFAAHGSGSQDPNDMTLTGSVSNVDGTHASSVGMVRTAETYSGSNGYSLRLDGLEPGFDDNDRPRAIVVHGADYATQSFIDDNGYLGRSWGCPATDPAAVAQVIDTLADGRLVLKYFDDPDWLASSAYVAP
jgi:hypothetical protein